MMLTFLLASCGGSDSGDGKAKTTAAKPAAPSNADDIKNAGTAVSDFVSGVRTGDGTAACASLTEVEQGIFVANAAEITPKLDTASCQSVVESFNEVSGSKVHLLDGSLGSVLVTGDFATGMWQWGGQNGDQAVILERTDKGWMMGRDANDFPTALLHFFDQG
jgi:hypothetical protein